MHDLMCIFVKWKAALGRGCEQNFPNSECRMSRQNASTSHLKMTSFF